MVVVWYRTNEKNISWPARPVRYNCQWPANALKIVIASELGSDVYGQPVLDPNDYPQAQIYRQNDSAPAGVQPQRGARARSSPRPPAAASTPRSRCAATCATQCLEEPSLPYVLLKYRKPADGNWAMQVYRVLRHRRDATTTSPYHGTAGTPVFPPYPVRLLPGCADDPGQGGPYWPDKVTARSGHAPRGQVTAHYNYPLLAGFDYGSEPLRLVELHPAAAGVCVPWLERRSGHGRISDPGELRHRLARRRARSAGRGDAALLEARPAGDQEPGGHGGGLRRVRGQDQPRQDQGPRPAHRPAHARSVPLAAVPEGHPAPSAATAGSISRSCPSTCSNGSPTIRPTSC